MVVKDRRPRRSGLADWVQAVGAVIAIVAGFAVAAFQTQSQNNASKKEKGAAVLAAHAIASEAMFTLSERLENAVTFDGKRKRSLQGNRTTEMVLALREFDTTRLPADILSDLTRLRSTIYAINERISELYLSEEVREEKARRSKVDRPKRFVSAARVWEETIGIFDQFQIKVSKHGVRAQAVNRGDAFRQYLECIKCGEFS